MGKLFIVYPDPQPLSREGVQMRVDEYFETLAPYTVLEVARAIQHAKAEPGRAFFPKPGELVEFILIDRRRREPELKSLPLHQAPPSPEELRTVRELLDALYLKLGAPASLREAVPGRPPSKPPTDEERWQHEQRKRAVLDADDRRRVDAAKRHASETGGEL